MSETLYERMSRQLIEDEENKTTISPTYSGAYDFLTDVNAADQAMTGEDLDRGFFGSLWRHALSSSTIGLTELSDTMRTEDWETKDTSERIGAALGEFAGMFVPFGVLGKGLRAGVGAVKGGTKQVFKTATQQATEQVTGEAAQNATRRAIQEGIKQNGGTTIFGNPRLFNQFHLGAKFADNAIDLTGEYVGVRLRKEFADAGLSYSDEMISNVVKTFKTGLRDGKYINSVEQWIDAGGAISNMAPGLKKNIAKWASMGLSESITLGLYNGISGMSMAGFRGDDFGSEQLLDGLKHSVALGFAFPAVRGLFGGGGNITVKDGWKNLWSTYKGMDYAAHAKKPGGARDLRLFIEELTGGKTKNALSGFKWTRADGTITTAPSSSKAISELSADDAVSLLNQMRSFTLGQGMRTWGKDWLNDMGKSSLRMVAGAIMNNTGLFYTEGAYSDAWMRLPKEETMTHLLIGAFFTRMRGHWNHNRKLSPEFKDQVRLANAMGMDSGGLQATIRQNENVSDLRRAGAGLHSDAVSKKIYETVENHVVNADKKEPLSGRKEKTELNSGPERDLDKVQHIYNAIKLFKGENPENLIDFRRLTPSERETLVTELNSIELMRDNAGKPIYFKDLSMADVLDVVNIRLGKGGEDSYLDFFRRLSNEVLDSEGNKVFNLVEGAEGERMLVPRITLSDNKEVSRKSLAEVNELMTYLEKVGVIEIDKANPVSAERFYENPNNTKVLDKVFRETSDKLVEDGFGPGQHLPSFDMFNPANAILSNIVKGRTVSALRTLYDIDSAKTANLNESQARLVEKLRTIFTGEDGKLIGNFSQIRDNLVKDMAKMEGLSSKEMTPEQASSLAELELLFDVWSLGKVDKSYSSKNVLDMAQVTEVINSFKEAGTGVAGQEILSTNFLESYRDYKLNRLLNTYISPEKAEIVRNLMESGEVRRKDDGNLEIANADAKYAQVFAETNNKNQASKAREAWQEILDYVGFLGGKLTHQQRVTATGTFSGDPIPLTDYSSIQKLYNMLPGTAAKYMSRDLLKAHDILESQIYDKDGKVDLTKNPLHSTLREIRAAIDSYATGEGSVQDIKLLVKKVTDRFKDPANKDRYVIHDGKQIKLSNILSQLQRQVTIAENKSLNAEKLFKSVMDTGVRTGDLTLKEAFDLLIEDEVATVYEFQNLIKTLIFQANGKGLTRAATIRFTSELKKKLMEDLRIQAEKSPDLGELVSRYNNDKSPESLRKIVEQVQTAMAVNAEVNTVRDGVLERQSKDFLERFSFRNHSVSLQALSEKFFTKSLLGDDIIDPKILTKSVEAFKTNDLSKLNDVYNMVRKRIEDYAPKADQKELLRDFDNGEGILFLKNLANMSTRPVAKVHQGMLIVDNAKAVIKGLGRDAFFEKAKRDYKIKDMFELERTGVEEGNQKSILKMDLSKVLEQYAQLTKEQWETFREAGTLQETDFLPQNIINPQNAAYVFPSKGRPLIVSADPSNLKGVGRWFSDWRLQTLDNIQKKIDKWSNEGNQVEANKLREIKENFSKATERLASDPTTKENMGLKLEALFWHEALPDMVENTYQNKFRGGGEMAESLKREHLKILKRLNLFEGGNLAPIDRTHLEYVSDFIVDRASEANSTRDLGEALKSRRAIKDILDRGLNIVTIADESKDSPFILKDAVLDRYTVRRDAALKAGNKELVKELEYAMENVRKEYDAGLMPSLDASIKNAVTYISESMARVLSEREGFAFDPTKMNGWKPIVYYRDPVTNKLVAEKTWFVFSPEKASMMERSNTHILTTESAAKVLLGDSNAGTFVKKFKASNRENWLGELEGQLGDAFKSELAINIPIEGLSIGSNSIIEKGVTGSMSLVNYQGKEGSRALIKYQRIEEILSEVGGMSHDLLNNVRSEIATAMYKYKSDQGGIKSFSDVQTITEALLKVGIRTDDPILKAGIERVFTSTTLQLLRRPKIDNGTSTYLIHDELSTSLRDPLYSNVLLRKTLTATPSEGFTFTDSKQDLRIMMRQGGMAKPAHWGDNIIRDLSNIRLVGNEKGVDIVFGIEGKKLKAINPLDLLSKDELLEVDKDVGGRRLNTKEFTKKVKPLMDALELMRENGTITTRGQLFDFLKNPTRYAIPSVASPKEIRSIIKDLDVQISTMELAIPRKSVDVIPTRVEHILDASYGNHSIVNNYDLAVGHQRDFDMDHLYSHDAMPFKMMRNQINSIGLQKDYVKQPTEAIDFSPFGESPVANAFMGQSKNLPGVKSALAQMETKKMEMGSAISMNQPLAWLANTGFSFNFGDGNFVKMNYSVSPENIRRVAGMISRIGNMTQAGVDAWQGDVVYQKDMGRNSWKLFTFGELPSDPKSIRDSDYNYNPMFNIKDSGLTKAQENVVHDIFFTAVQALKKGQSIFNDGFSDGAKVKITPYDINRNHQLIMDTFGPNRNEIIFTKLLRKYKATKDAESEKALYKLFFGLTGEAKVRDQFSLEKIRERVEKGKDLSGILDIIQFDKPGRNAKELMDIHPAGRIYNLISENKIYQHDNTSHYPASKGGGVLADAMNITRDLRGKVALLRATGALSLEALSDPSANEKYSDITTMINSKLKRTDVRDIAYTELKNQASRIQGKINELKKFTRSETNIEITSLHEEMRNVESTLKLLEMQAMSEFGGNEKAQLSLRRLNPRKDGTHANWPNPLKRSVSVYQVPSTLDLSDPSTIKNLVYGNSTSANGIKFVTDLKPGHSFKGNNNKKYIVLENPLISHYITDAKVTNGYAWLRVTNSVDGSRVALSNSPTESSFHADIDLARIQMTESHRERGDRIKRQKTRINSGPIYGEQGISEDLNTISRLMRTWAHEGEGAGWAADISTLSREKVRVVALKLIEPTPVPRNYVRTGENTLPHFVVNDKIVNNLMRWLHEYKYMDTILEDLKLKTEIYANIKNGLNPMDIQYAERSLDIHRENYWEVFESQWKGSGDLVISMMSDKTGVTGNFMADLLKDNNIIKLSTGEKVTLLESNGVLKNGREQNVNYLKDGDLNPKRRNYCR